MFNDWNGRRLFEIYPFIENHLIDWDRNGKWLLEIPLHWKPSSCRYIDMIVSRRRVCFEMDVVLNITTNSVECIISLFWYVWHTNELNNCNQRPSRRNIYLHPPLGTGTLIPPPHTLDATESSLGLSFMMWRAEAGIVQLLSNGVARHSWDRFRRLCLQHFSCPFVSLRRLYSFCASFPCRLTPFGSTTTTSTTSALKPITQIKTQRSNLANFRLSKDDATKGDQCKYSHVMLQIMVKVAR